MKRRSHWSLTPGQWRHLWKSALGAAIAVAIGGQLDRLQPDVWNVSDTTWSAVTVIVVLQANLGGLLQASSNRLQGTAIGGICGTLVGLLLGFSPLSVGIAVFLSLTCCLVARLNDALRLAGLTSLIVQSSFALSVSQPWLVGLGRFSSVFVGIAIAVGISLVLWPRQALRQLEQGLRSLFAEAATLYAALDLLGTNQTAIAPEQRQASIQTLRQQLRQNRQTLQEIQHEPWLDSGQRSHLELQAREADALVFALHALVELRREGPLPPTLAIANLDRLLQPALQELATTLTLSRDHGQQLAQSLQAQFDRLRQLRQERALRSLDESDLLRGLAILQELALIKRLLLRLGNWEDSPAN